MITIPDYVPFEEFVAANPVENASSRVFKLPVPEWPPAPSPQSSGSDPAP